MDAEQLSVGYGHVAIVKLCNVHLNVYTFYIYIYIYIYTCTYAYAYIYTAICIYIPHTILPLVEFTSGSLNEAETTKNILSPL